MKKLILITILLLVNFLVYPQYHAVLFDDSGNPIAVRFLENETVKNHFFNEVSDDGIYTIDTYEGKLIIDAGLYNESTQETDSQYNRADIMTNFDPSPALNGDFVQKISYTKDGESIVVLHRHSDNLVFYNSSTYEIEHVIDLGRGPMDMKVTDDHIYVCCYYSKEIQTVDLDTYTVTTNVKMQHNPCQIELNLDTSILYVAFTDDDMGGVAAYSLDNGIQIFETNDPKIYIKTKEGENGRVGIKFMKFFLSPNGDKFIASNGYWDMSGIYSAVTGELLQTYSLGEMLGAGYSSSGDTLFGAFIEHDSKSYKAYRIDMTNLVVIDSIMASTLNVGNYSDLCISSDGTKMLSTGDWLINDLYFFDFDTYQYNIIPSAGMKYSNTVLKIEDLDYAVITSLGYFDIIDMNTGQLVATSTDDIEVGWTGAISPSGNSMLLSDCVAVHANFEYMGEALHAIDISDPSSYNVDTSFYTGNAYEADETKMAYLMDDRKKFIACNTLSHNISIIDVETGLTDTLIYCQSISGLELIPGKNQAIIYADYHDTIRIMDLNTYKYIAHIDIGNNNVKALKVTDDGQWAYLLDSDPNTWDHKRNLSKIMLDGDSSKIVDKIVINASWARFWNLNTGIVIYGAADLSPDGKYFFFLERDDNGDHFIGIVNTAKMKIEASLPTEAWAVLSFAFSDDSKWALPLFFTYSLPIVYIDGENSFINDSFPVNHQCLSAEYNPVDSMFYVLQSLYQYHVVDPESVDIIETIDTDEMFQYKIGMDNEGNPAILTAEKLIYKDVTYTMIGQSTVMNYYEDRDVFVIPVSGPDKIVTMGDISVEIPESSQFTEQSTFVIMPNPAVDIIRIKSDYLVDRVEIIDISGTVQIRQNTHSYIPIIDVSLLKTGVYIVRLISNNDAVYQKMVKY